MDDLELDNYDSEYGSVIWPQHIISRPKFVKKLYAPPMSMPAQLPGNILKDYKDITEKIEATEKAIQEAENEYTTLSSTIVKPVNVWRSKQSAREAEDKRLIKELEMAGVKKQTLADLFNTLVKQRDPLMKIIDLQTELESAYASRG